MHKLIKKTIKINWLNSDVCSGLCVISLCTGNKTLDLQIGSLSILHLMVTRKTTNLKEWLTKKKKRNLNLLLTSTLLFKWIY